MLYEKGPHHHQLSPEGIEGKLEKNSGGYSTRTRFYVVIIEAFLWWHLTYFQKYDLIIKSKYVIVFIFSILFYIPNIISI